MVYVLLGSETEDIYSALFAVIRNILPLNYDRILFVTDYERDLTTRFFFYSPRNISYIIQVRYFEANFYFPSTSSYPDSTVYNK